MSSIVANSLHGVAAPFVRGAARWQSLFCNGKLRLNSGANVIGNGEAGSLGINPQDGQQVAGADRPDTDIRPVFIAANKQSVFARSRLAHQDKKLREPVALSHEIRSCVDTITIAIVKVIKRASAPRVTPCLAWSLNSATGSNRAAPY